MPAKKLRGPRTTSGTLAVDNLNAQIQGREDALVRTPDDLGVRGQLVELLLTRAEFLGKITDYDRAAALVADEAPTSAAGFLLRAKVRARLHLFEDALSDLDRAAQAGGEADAIARQRATIEAARGQTTIAGQLVAGQDAEALWTRAGIAADDGQLDEAIALYDQALDVIHTTLPFPVAWIDFQAGLALERAGRAVDARARYEAARQRLPAYAPATGHLAGVRFAEGDAPGAIALLEPLVVASDDPEYLGQLAVAYRKVGRAADGDAAAAKAGAAYDALVARHELAFADHAARFWLGAGGDPAKAVRLAAVNAANRPTEEAITLAIDAALAARDATRACAFADRVKDRPNLGKAGLVAAWRAFKACGRAEAADAMDARLRR